MQCTLQEERPAVEEDDRTQHERHVPRTGESRRNEAEQLLDALRVDDHRDRQDKRHPEPLSEDVYVVTGVFVGRRPGVHLMFAMFHVFHVFHVFAISSVAVRHPDGAACSQHPMLPDLSRGVGS